MGIGQRHYEQGHTIDDWKLVEALAEIETRLDQIEARLASNDSEGRCTVKTIFVVKDLEDLNLAMRAMNKLKHEIAPRFEFEVIEKTYFDEVLCASSGSPCPPRSSSTESGDEGSGSTGRPSTPSSPGSTPTR